MEEVTAPHRTYQSFPSLVFLTPPELPCSAIERNATKTPSEGTTRILTIATVQFIHSYALIAADHPTRRCLSGGLAVREVLLRRAANNARILLNTSMLHLYYFRKGLSKLTRVFLGCGGGGGE